jgi:adhesin transport system outer membrane protein
LNHKFPVTITRRKYPINFALLLITSCMASLAAAQSPATLKDAVERAVLQNPEVKLRFHNLEAAQQERKAGEGAWLPRIDLEAATAANQLSTPSLASALNYTGNRTSIQLRQTIFDGFATLHEVRRLSYSQQSSYFELMSASNQTGLEAARAYIDVLRFRELVTLASENFTTHQEVHDRINQKVMAGVGRRVDLEQASGRMALAESNWLTEVSNLHDVSARYQRLVGDTPSETLARLGPLDEFLPIGTEFLTDATKRNPDFLAAVATIRAYRADMQVRRSALSPTVELRARQSFETNQSGVTGDYRSSTLEMVLSYNLFKGGSDMNRVKQYAAKLESAYDLRDKACRDIWQTGQIAFNDSIRLVAQLKLLSQHELATSKARQAYQQQFDIGQRSLLDLLDTENELYQARRSLIMGEHDLQLAEVRVLATSGSLLSALKLQTLASDLPNPSGGTQDDDDLLQCSNRILPSLTLNRVFDSRPATLPADPVRTAPAVPVVPVAPTAPLSAPSPEPKGDANACKELPGVVESWLGAWNRKDFSAYLGAYADNFQAAKGLSRSKWEQLRKSRINKPGNIQATITQIRPVNCDARNAEIAFTQGYGSVDYRDQVEKTLSLEKVQGVWKITRETVTKGRTF